MADGPLWTPDTERVTASAMDRFRRVAATRSGTPLADAAALHEWSVRDPGAFWGLLWDEAGVIGDKGRTSFVDAASMVDARFFPEASLNFAENLLRRRDGAWAIRFLREDGVRRDLTAADLANEVARTAAALRGAGVQPGDRVAAWMPNLPETVIAMLATAATGAVFTSTSPDFGTAGVVDRFGQVEPVVLFAADGYTYGGKEHDCLARLREIKAALPTVREVIVVPNLVEAPDVSGVPGARLLREFGAGFDGSTLEFARLPFDHPGFILYSSGTTGPPKCIVHRAGGLVLKHLSEHRLHCDVRPGDVVFYFTTCGWMMWNWLTSALASEATIVLYDGSPFHPGPEAMFDLADEYGVTLFGTSAKFIDGTRKAGLVPAGTHSLATLRTITSTGSPLAPEGFRFVYEEVKPDVHLASISGGTDLCGCFVGGDPTRPVWPGEIQMAGLGMAVDVYDDDGHPLRDGKGELVCTRAFPTVPLHFWNDPGGAKLRSAYFERFPGVWAHGDFASWTDHGGMVIYGRSDATLNAGGVRIGTAEIYRQVEQLPEIEESIAVGQEWEGDTRIVLFLRMGADHDLDDALRARIRALLREQCSPRHVPARIVAVPDIPRTRSGKIVELAVGDVVNGRPVRNREALANPEALDLFRDLPELQT